MNYLDQNKLKVVSDLIVDDLDGIFNYFNVKLHQSAKKYYGACPIHCGDGEKSPFNLFTDGYAYRGNWICRSRNCHTIFKKSIIGLVRGLLSRKKVGWRKDGDSVVSFNDSVEWCLGWVGKDYKSIQVDYNEIEKNKFIRNQMMISRSDSETKGCPEYIVRKLLDIPSTYFADRGYNKELLSRLMVGECRNPQKPMNNRAVVPIADITGKIVGFSGRSIFEICDQCKYYHAPDSPCIDQYTQYKHHHVKWRHSDGFMAENHLYGIDQALPEINKTFSVCLVESPGNVWKLMQNGVKNVVATFGSHLTEGQLEVLMRTKALILNLLYDNDDAGRAAIKQIESIASRLYNINVIKINDSGVNDVSDMEDQDIVSEIIPQIKGGME